MFPVLAFCFVLARSIIFVVVALVNITTQLDRTSNIQAVVK